MCKEQLINIIINSTIALGTISVSILAIWGDRIKQIIAGPKLFVEPLKSEYGTFAIHNEETNLKAKYLYVKVINKNNAFVAIKTRVLINKIDILQPGGSFVSQNISGPLPLFWQFSRVDPIYFPPLQSIGPSNICDIGFLEQGRNFIITTPINLKEYRFELVPNGKMRLELIAIAENAKSKSLFVEISWDGTWVDDATKISEHLSLRKIKRF